MRYTEAMREERDKPEPKKKGKKKEEPRILAGNEEYDYAELGRMKPLRGGSPYGS